MQKVCSKAALAGLRQQLIKGGGTTKSRGTRCTQNCGSRRSLFLSVSTNTAATGLHLWFTASRSRQDWGSRQLKYLHYSYGRKILIQINVHHHLPLHFSSTLIILSKSNQVKCLIWEKDVQRRNNSCFCQPHLMPLNSKQTQLTEDVNPFVQTGFTLWPGATSLWPPPWYGGFGDPRQVRIFPAVELWATGHGPTGRRAGHKAGGQRSTQLSLCLHPTFS